MEQFVFLDEAGVNSAMTRLFGWGSRHERVEEYVPDARFERSTILSSVRLSGVCAQVSFEGVLNGDLFALYVKYVLAPTLNEGDVLLLDNLSSHKVVGVFDPIYECGAFVWFLSAYSSDLNPIELLWSKVKFVLRKCKVRSFEEL
ncbi:MAG: transposase [Candidatus Bathyarchaeota archaeon]|nr:transposase [Candidatus Termiticorpusculum sp.]